MTLLEPTKTDQTQTQRVIDIKMKMVDDANYKAIKNAAMLSSLLDQYYKETVDRHSDCISLLYFKHDDALLQWIQEEQFGC